MSTFKILFLILITSCFHSQIYGQSILGNEFERIVDSIISNKIAINYKFTDFYKSHQFVRLLEISNDEEIEFLCSHQIEAVKKTGINIKYQKEILEFPFETSIDTVNFMIEKIVKFRPVNIAYGDLASSYFSSREFHFIRNRLPNKEVIKLLKHPSHIIRALSARILFYNENYELLIPFIIQNGMKKEYISYQDGCVIESGLLGDFIIFLIYNRSLRPNSNLDSTLEKIDSVLIYNDNILQSSAKAFFNLEPTEHHLNRLNTLYFKKQYFPAIVPLLKMDNKNSKLLKKIEECFFKQPYKKYSPFIWVESSTVRKVISDFGRNIENEFSFMFLHSLHNRLMKMSKDEIKLLDSGSIRSLYTAIMESKTDEVYQLLLEVTASELIENKFIKHRINLWTRSFKKN